MFSITRKRCNMDDRIEFEASDSDKIPFSFAILLYIRIAISDYWVYN